MPGNHDVGWTDSQLLLNQHEYIRERNQADRLSDLLMDADGRRLLLGPFRDFNDFARPFGCCSDAERIHWESDALSLNDGSTLRIRGLNSALVSDKRDRAIDRPCQVLGTKQVQLRDDDDGVTYLTLCHHPPRWLYDDITVQDHLNQRAAIQLFGHDHLQRAAKVNNSVVLYAGALHPSRNEVDWQPRYNVLRVAVRVTESRQLSVDVYQRVWKPSETRFGPEVDANGENPLVFDVNLHRWLPPAAPCETLPATAVTAVPSDAVESRMTLRAVIYDYFELSYPRRIRILLDHGLIEPDDAGAQEAQLLYRAIERSISNDTLADLRRAIKEALRE